MRILSLIILVVFSNSMLAQTTELRNFTVEDGLPQSQVYAIAQDSIGYLWLGTQGGGLARFDGERFTIINEEDGLLSNYVNTIITVKNTLIVGTNKGLSIYENKKFTNHTSPTIRKLYGKDALVIAATNQGVYYLENNKFEKAALSKTINESSIQDIFYDGAQFWIATTTGLFTTKTITSRSVINQVAKGNFTSIVKDVFHTTTTQPHILVATFEQGISQYRLDGKLLFSTNAPQQITHVTTINNELWVATETSGIHILDLHTLRLQKHITQQQGLSVSHIRQVFNDYNNDTWIASSGGGLFKYFPNEFTHYDEDTGLAANYVYAVAASKNKVWFSTADQGLSYIDSLGIKKVPTVKGFENVKIKALAVDNKGSVWAGSEGKGIWYRHIRTYDSLAISGKDFASLKMDTLKITQSQDYIFNVSNGLTSNFIRALYPDNDTLWAATYGSGIIKLSFDHEEEILNIQATYAAAQGIQDARIRDIQPDGDGRIWYGTETGALGYIANNKVTHLGNVLKISSPVNTLVFKNKTLYVGTEDSGIYYSTQDDYTVFRPLTGAKQTTSKNSYQLLFDAQDQLWTGSERGVDKLLLNNNHEIVDVFHYGRNDGFLGIETCLNAIALDAENNIWFGAIYGLTKFDASKNSATTTAKPTIYFTNIAVGYTPLNPANGFKISGQQELKPEENQLSFQYQTVDLNHPAAIQYRYKLDDAQWSPWSEVNQQNFAGLGYGEHTFTVQSRNFRWEKSDPLSYTFRIGTPLIKQVWFQWTVFIILLLLISLIVYSYIRRLKKKNHEKQMQLKLENHLLGLEQKALRLQMNPHFIFNVLNGIKAMGVTDTKKMNTTINTFATLLRGILHNSRKDAISLTEEVSTLTNYIAVEQLMATTPFKYEVAVDVSHDPDEVLIPPMLVQPFVENAIQHGITSFKTTKAGSLHVRFYNDDAYLYCTIIDNGPGIFESQKNKKASSHQSVAIEVTKERMESLGGKGAMQIDEIIENDTIVGTQVRLRIPLSLEF